MNKDYGGTKEGGRREEQSRHISVCRRTTGIVTWYKVIHRIEILFYSEDVMIQLYSHTYNITQNNKTKQFFTA